MTDHGLLDGWVSNAAMRRWAADLPVSAPADLPLWLDQLLSRGIRAVDGYALLADAVVSDSVVVHQHDATGVETFLNHFHVDSPDGSLLDLAVALTAAAALGNALSCCSLAGTARVIVSRSLREAALNSTVRFHRLRSGETWLSTDLESYSSEAVGYLDVEMAGPSAAA